jgi:hypothetical protein
MPKEDGWNDVDHVYQKTLIKYKHMNERLGKKEMVVGT